MLCNGYTSVLDLIDMMILSRHFTLINYQENCKYPALLLVVFRVGPILCAELRLSSCCALLLRTAVGAVT